MSLGFRTALLVIPFTIWFKSELFANDESFVRRMRSAWEARQSQFNTFVIEWVARENEPVGLHGRDRDNNPIPKSDMTLSIRHRMKGYSNRMRLDRSGVQFDLDSLKYIEKSFVRTFDGAQRREEFLANSEHKRGGGFIRSGLFEDGSYLAISPILLYFRPLVKELGGIDLGLFQDIGQSVPVDGVSCRILERSLDTKRVDRIFVAEERGFNVLRRQVGAIDSPCEELKLSFEPHSERAWSCTGWTYVYYPNCLRTRRPAITTALVTVCEGNIDLKQSEFQHQFPPGTVITDQDTGGRLIARDDGTLRQLTPGELSSGASFDELAKAAPPPEIPSLTPRMRYASILTFVGGISLVVCASILMRRTDR